MYEICYDLGCPGNNTCRTWDDKDRSEEFDCTEYFNQPEFFCQNKIYLDYRLGNESITEWLSTNRELDNLQYIDCDQVGVLEEAVHIGPCGDSCKDYDCEEGVMCTVSECGDRCAKVETSYTCE